MCKPRVTKKLEITVGTYMEVWGVAQRRSCLRGMLLLHAEMLVSPNATNEAAYLPVVV